MADALLRMAERVARGAWRVDLPAFTSTWSDQVRAIRELPDGFVPVLDDAIESYVAHEADHRVTERGGGFLRGRCFAETELMISFPRPATGRGARA